jgi:hypothetical protein
MSTIRHADRKSEKNPAAPPRAQAGENPPCVFANHLKLYYIYDIPVS